MRRLKLKHANDASQPNDSEPRVTIVFPESPFCGQSGRLLAERLGIHCDLKLQLSDGRHIKIDRMWADYARGADSEGQGARTHSIDLTRAGQLIDFIRYLNHKHSRDGL